MWFARVAECRMNLFNRHATLKPLKAHKAGKRSELSEYSKKTLATLGTGSMRAGRAVAARGEHQRVVTHTHAHTHIHATHSVHHDASHSVTATSPNRSNRSLLSPSLLCLSLCQAGGPCPYGGLPLSTELSHVVRQHRRLRQCSCPCSTAESRTAQVGGQGGQSTTPLGQLHRVCPLTAVLLLCPVSTARRRLVLLMTAGDKYQYLWM